MIVLWIKFAVFLFPLDFVIKSSLSQAVEAIKANDHAQLNASSLTPGEGVPVLKLAAERGFIGCVRVLLAEGKFDPNGSNMNGVTPLHLATNNAHKGSICSSFRRMFTMSI